MNDAAIIGYSVVRGSFHKHGYGHKQATATPSVAGVTEAGDCGGDVAAGLVGGAGGAALRRERPSGFRLAAALPGRCGGTGRASLAACEGDAGSAGGGGTSPRERGDRDRVGRRLSRSDWRGCPGRDAAAGAGRIGAAMIPVPSEVRVWLAVSRTDMMGWTPLANRGQAGPAFRVQRGIVMDVKVIGVDIAKRYFQVHGINASGVVMIRRKISRDGFLKLFAALPPCLVGL